MGICGFTSEIIQRTFDSGHYPTFYFLEPESSRTLTSGLAELPNGHRASPNVSTFTQQRSMTSSFALKAEASAQFSAWDRSKQPSSTGTALTG
jgi:hypothetical protein